MLLAVYAGDQNILNRLWQFYKDNSNERGIMHWKTFGCNSNNGQNGATDAEVDAAMALIIADCQWGSAGHAHNYAQDAESLMSSIQQYEVSQTDFTFFHGDAWQPDCRNPSYQAPGYTEYWAEWLTARGKTAEAAFWTNVAAATRSLHVANSGSTPSGLPSNWSLPSGPANPSCAGSGTSWDGYGYDACRAPWRQGTDYLWNGTASMQTIINTQTDHWVAKGGATTIEGGNGVNQNGSGNGDHVHAFVGMVGAQSLAASPTSTNQSFVDSLYTENNKNIGPSYFNQILKVMGLFVQTGNFWKPCATTTPLERMYL